MVFISNYLSYSFLCNNYQHNKVFYQNTINSISFIHHNKTYNQKHWNVQMYLYFFTFYLFDRELENNHFDRNESNDKWSVSLLPYLGKFNLILSQFYLCGDQTDIVLEATKQYNMNQTSLQNWTLRGDVFICMFAKSIVFCFNCFCIESGFTTLWCMSKIFILLIYFCFKFCR